MQAASSSSEDRGGGKTFSGPGKTKLSVSDLVSDDFKKAWLALKDIHDKELHRLQMKLTNMRKARLTEGRRYGPVAKNKPGTAIHDTYDPKLCDRCLMNETYRNVLQKEFSNMQQKNLVKIAELTVENNILKEENRKLSEKLKANQPRVRLSFSDSDYDDVTNGAQMKKKQVYTVKEPPQSLQLFPRQVMQPHIEQKKSVDHLNVETSPGNNPTPGSSEGIFEVPETSFVDSPTVDDNFSKEVNVFPSCTAYSLTTTLEASKKDDVNSVSSVFEVKEKTCTQKWEKNTFTWSLSSISSGEPIIMVSETSEESMPCNPKKVLPPLTKKNEPSSTQGFPVDCTSKCSQKRRLSFSGISHKNDISMKSSTAPLPSRGETPQSNTDEPENVRPSEKKHKNKIECVPSGSMLKRKVSK